MLLEVDITALHLHLGLAIEVAHGEGGVAHAGAYRAGVDFQGLAMVGHNLKNASPWYRRAMRWWSLMLLENAELVFSSTFEPSSNCRRWRSPTTVRWSACRRTGRLLKLNSPISNTAAVASGFQWGLIRRQALGLRGAARATAAL